MGIPCSFTQAQRQHETHKLRQNITLHLCKEENRGLTFYLQNWRSPCQTETNKTVVEKALISANWMQNKETGVYSVWGTEDGAKLFFFHLWGGGKSVGRLNLCTGVMFFVYWQHCGRVVSTLASKQGSSRFKHWPDIAWRSVWSLIYIYPINNYVNNHCWIIKKCSVYRWSYCPFMKFIFVKDSVYISLIQDEDFWR